MRPLQTSQVRDVTGQYCVTQIHGSAHPMGGHLPSEWRPGLCRCPMPGLL